MCRPHRRFRDADRLFSFNLDGSTLYLAMASVFVAQAAEATTGQHMGLAARS